jgi:hypothetical protein
VLGRRSQTGKRIGVSFFDERSYEEMMKSCLTGRRDVQTSNRRTVGFYVTGTGLAPFSEFVMLIKMEEDSHTSMSSSLPVAHTHTQPWCSKHVYVRYAVNVTPKITFSSICWFKCCNISGLWRCVIL